jgi:O-antigen/teichoic acid export membrane protein
LLRASLTLLAGGALAQALPLLLGPWLTRLYGPEEFGRFHLFTAIAANLAVIACARYEFALPMATEATEAHALRRLALRLLAGATLLCALIGAVWAWRDQAADPLALPLAVASLGLLSLATLWATRLQRFRALAAARVLQHAGGAFAQGLAGVAGLGLAGLIGGPIVAAFVAALWLRLPFEKGPAAQPAIGDVARRYRDFPLLNAPHAFVGALQDTVAVALIASWLGSAEAGFWGLTLRYLKAPATLVGGAVSQALYPQLSQAGAGPTPASRQAVRRLMLMLALIASPLVLALWALGPWAFEALFGPGWRPAGELARALALYIGLHFVASPLAVVTMAWRAQRWALKLALIGQLAFIGALAAGMAWDGLVGAGWAVSATMLLYFGSYFWRLATWPLVPARPPAVEQSAR